MPSSKELLKALDGGAFDALFARLYGPGSLPYQRKRYGGAVKAFVDCFGDRRTCACSPRPDVPRSAAITPTTITAGCWPPV